jgi:lipid A 3-O-deacylase PagL
MPKLPRFVVAATIAATAAACTPPAVAGAQTTVLAPVDSAREGLPTLIVRPPSIYGAWAAAARHSAFHTRTGVPGHRNFYLTSFRLGWSLGGSDARRPVSGAYFIDVIPAAISTDMPDYNWNSRCRPDTLCPGATPIPHDVYAFGLTPFGWALTLGAGPARLTMEASAGGLWFTRRVPDPVGTRFNFTAAAGPTVELHVTPSQSLRLGYLWHHTSNGGTGKVNPGLNSGILALGVLWRGAPDH